MLTVFLIVLGVVGFRPETALGCGSADMGEGLGGGGRFVVEGALSLLWGVWGADLADGMLPVLFLVLLMGRAGKAMLGGPFDGPEGRGSAVVMLARWWKSAGCGQTTRPRVLELPSCRDPSSSLSQVHEQDSNWRAT